MNKLFEITSKMMKQENTKNIDLAAFLEVSAQVFGNWVARESIPEKYASKIADYYKTDLTSLYDENVKPIKKISIINAVNCGNSTKNANYSGFASYKGDGEIEKFYCVIACGDNMSPEIEDGDEIICNPVAKIKSGDIVHYKIENENAVKIYVKDDDADIVQLVPYTQNKDFKTKTIRLDDENINLIVAKVVAVNKLNMKSNQARLKLIGRAI
ncbi:MAG: helix-turn-helix domain-containing protein [Campylobacteraceae bacterium]|jgi:phage repressor protein C with HTH and peptisase S24 domain|nr:helix-turn-helix domain-containing protein [Campylobacteraceae bacterium]